MWGNCAPSSTRWLVSGMCARPILSFTIRSKSMWVAVLITNCFLRIFPGVCRAITCTPITPAPIKMITAPRPESSGGSDFANSALWSFVGIVADFSANYGDLKFQGPVPPACAIGVVCHPLTESANAHIDNFLVGPRVSVSVGSFRPFAEALFGAGHVNTNGFGSDTSFATALGGGLDYRLFRLLAWRVQGAYIPTNLFNQ